MKKRAFNYFSTYFLVNYRASISNSPLEHSHSHHSRTRPMNSPCPVFESNRIVALEKRKEDDSASSGLHIFDSAVGVD